MTETEEQKLEKPHGFELKTMNGYKLDEVVSALQRKSGVEMNSWHSIGR